VHGGLGGRRSLSAGGGAVVDGAGRRAADRVAGAAASRRRRRLVHVLVDGAPARVHKEVDDRRHLEAELFGNRRLDLLARALYLLEDGDQRASLDLGEDHARLLGGARRRRGHLSAVGGGGPGLLRRDRLRRRRRRAQQRPVSTALARCQPTHTVNTASYQPSPVSSADTRRHLRSANRHLPPVVVVVVVVVVVHVLCSWLPPFCKPNLILLIQPRWQLRTYFFYHYNVLF